VAAMIELDNTELALVEDLFDPPGREGTPARYPRRQVVDAILLLARTGCQWRYLPACYPPWEAVWQQWRRWRASGVWARAMAGIAALGRGEAEHRHRDPGSPARGPGRVGPPARRQRGPAAPRRCAPRTRHGQGDRGRPRLQGPRQNGRQAPDQPRHQGPAEGDGRLHPDRTALPRRARLRPPGPLRRLSRCHEGTPESARAWLEVAVLAYLFARLRVEPA